MKKLIPITITGLLIMTAILAFRAPERNATTSQPQDQPALFPEDISTIFETSCYDCHGEAGSNAKAKTKLNYGKWADMSAAKKVGKIEKIAEVVKKGDMPPGKYLEKKPEAKLNQEQVEAITKWASDETSKLMGEGK